MALSNEEMIFKQMIDNINEPFAIIINKSHSFFFNLYGRGYHAYINIWHPVDKEILVYVQEINNPHDSCAVSIMRNSSCFSAFEQAFSKLSFAAWYYHIMYCHWERNKS